MYTKVYIFKKNKNKSIYCSVIVLPIIVVDTSSKKFLEVKHML